MRSHSPASRHRRNREYTVVHGPYRSGRSRPGAPGSQNPDDPVEHSPVIPRGASGARALRGPQGREPLPLVVGEFVSSLWAHAPSRA